MYVFICMRPIIRGRLGGPLYGRLRAAQTSVLVRALQEEEELRLLRQGGVLGGGGCGRGHGPPPATGGDASPPNPANPNADMTGRPSPPAAALEKLIAAHVLHRPSDDEKRLLWAAREELVGEPRALPKVLLAVDWGVWNTVGMAATAVAERCRAQVSDSKRWSDAIDPRTISLN